MASSLVLIERRIIPIELMQYPKSKHPQNAISIANTFSKSVVGIMFPLTEVSIIIEKKKLFIY